MCVVYHCQSSELQQYVLCRRTSARRARADSLPDFSSMDDAGAVALRANENSSSSSSSCSSSSLQAHSSCVFLECLTSAVAAARDCQQITLLQPSCMSHVVPMYIWSKRGFSVLYRTICEKANVDFAILVHIQLLYGISYTTTSSRNTNISPITLYVNSRASSHF